MIEAMRSVLEGELRHIRDNIAVMGAQTVDATARAVQALIQRDRAEASNVKHEDKLLDVARYDVEHDCLVALATQQPVARDLRILIAASIIAVELERCGDYAKGIAKAARRTNSDMPTFNLAEMDALARDMLDRSIKAFLNCDVQMAQEVIAADSRLDQAYNDLFAQTMAMMSSNPKYIEDGLRLLRAAHNLERLGDRATNIAERVLFIESGDLPSDVNQQAPNQVPAA
jgi:phosphate transport system protein